MWRVTGRLLADNLVRNALANPFRHPVQLPPHRRAHIAAIAHLSGGNPRLIMLLHELLSQKRVTTIVQQLRRLVDELTPLLKHELENLPAQQQKIVHALMEQGGTATPTPSSRG